MEIGSSDPIDWSVDDVVSFLCNPESAPWAQSVKSARPDHAALETALRDNFIAGEVLLHDVDSDAIKNDLGVKALGHRSSLTRAIEWLRLRSPKYQTSKRNLTTADDLSTAMASHNGSLSPHPSTPVITPSNPATTLSLTAPNPQAQVAGQPRQRRVVPTLISGSEELSIRQAATQLPGDQAQAVAPPLSASFDSRNLNNQSTDPDQDKNGTTSSIDDMKTSQTLSLNRDWFTSKLEEDLLRKYPPGDGDEEALPVYGESGSENEWDSQDWKELLDERPQLAQQGWNPTGSQAFLPPEVLESVISRYIHGQEEIWKKQSLPKELPFARPLWERSRRGDNLEQITEETSARLDKYNHYLIKLKKGILDSQYKSEASVLRSCPALDPTLSRIFLEKWRLSVLEKEECPPEAELPTKARRPPKERDDSVEPAGAELSEDLGSSSGSNDPIDDDDMENFIVEDDIDTEPDSHPQGMIQGLPFELASSESSDNEDASDSSLNSPARKKRRVAQYGEDEEEKNDSQRLNPTASRFEPTEDPSQRHALMSVNQNTPITTQETRDVDEMEIATPPLNPMCLETAEDADLTDAQLSLGPVDPPTDSLSSNVALQGHSATDDSTGSESHADTQGSTVNSEDIELFSMLMNSTLKSIEAEKNRIHLLAKLVMGLTAAEIDLFPSFLTQYIQDIYEEFVQEALQAMLNNDRHVEGRDPEQSALAMRMSALFVSWFHCIVLQPTTPHKRLVQEALDALEDGETSLFPTFFERLKSLITAVQVWAFSDESHGSNDSNRTEAEKWSKSTLRLSKNKKRGLASRPLSHQQSEAQDRQVRQEKLRNQMRIERERKGLSNSDPVKQMVTFKEPIIYLHPHIGALVKPHQLKGIQFLWRELIEAKNPQGCLLAHVMGLGKTMQVVSFLATVAAAAESPNPEIQMLIPSKFRRSRTLIVCPSPLIENWLDEFAIWLPEDHKIGTIRHIVSRARSGGALPRPDTIQAWIEEGGILIMSYEMLRMLVQNKNASHGDPLVDEEHAKIRKWLLEGPNIIIADEAHRLRNEKTAISQIATSFKSNSRIAMTGSPLANHLSEYYHMVDWVAPGYLGEYTYFKLRFIDPIQDGSYMDSTVAQQRESLVALKLLNGIIGPKVLRADTSVIASDLPPKIEFVLCVPLTELQKQAYNIFVSSLTAAEYVDSAAHLWSWLALIQLCDNHPFPFREKLADRYQQVEYSEAAGDAGMVSVLPRTIKEAGLPSGLLPRIDELFETVENLRDLRLSNRTLLLTQILNESINAGDKVLIFTQSIPTMDYLSRTLDVIGHKFARIDGRTPSYDRQTICKKFNSTEDEYILLISTRAGGLGLNMFGANRVVIFDFLFNPTWEEQAVGRAYRLGQKKPVYVYRFIASGTFEDIIFSNATFKSQLAVRVVDKKNVIRESAKQTTRYLFPVHEHEKESCTDIMGKDPLVLDRVLTGEYAYTILKASLSRIQDNENDRLTEHEHKRVNEELELELLKRTDPAKYRKEMEKRQLAEVQREREFQRQQQELEQQQERLVRMNQQHQQNWQGAHQSSYQNPRSQLWQQQQYQPPNMTRNQRSFDGQTGSQPVHPGQQEGSSSTPAAPTESVAASIPSAGLVDSNTGAQSTIETSRPLNPAASVEPAPSQVSETMDISDEEETQASALVAKET